MSAILYNVALEKVVREMHGVEKVGLTINPSKTKIMELINSDVDSHQREKITFENMKDLKYLGTTLNIKNEWSKETNICISKAKKTFYALMKFFNSKMLPTYRGDPKLD